MRVIQGTNWWDYPKGVWILPKRWGVVKAAPRNLPKGDATSNDVLSKLKGGIESDTRRSEEQSEGGEMEVDLVATL